MEKQVIISIGRESGSGGHEIANELGTRFNLPVYDSNLLSHIAEEKSLDAAHLKRFDEKRRNPLLSRNVRGYTNAPEDAVAELQFNYLREMAAAGKSFIIVGRCADHVLKGTPGLITIFILADEKDRIAHIAHKSGIPIHTAADVCAKVNKSRIRYHNYYADSKWGDPRTYDLCINRSRCGYDETTDILEEYIKARIRTMKDE